MADDFNVFTVGRLALDGTNLFGVDTFNEDPQWEGLMFRQSGRVMPQMRATATVKPVFTFDTPEVEKVLSTYIDTTTLVKNIGTTVTVVWTKKDEAVRSTGADWQTTTINEGLVVPTALTWGGENSPWILSCSVFTSYDGSNNPFVYGTASAPALGLIDEMFLGGKVQISTVDATAPTYNDEFDGWQSGTLNFNYNIQQRNSQGDIYPGVAYVETANPSLELVDLELAERSQWGIDGTRFGRARMFLRKCGTNLTDGVARIADGTAEHLELVFAEGICRMGATSGADDSDAQVNLRLEISETDSIEAIVVNANQTIP